MTHDEERKQGTDLYKKFCGVCNIDYDGDECPSCNPRRLYHVEIGVDAGGDEFKFSDCLCGCVDFWNKKEAVAHAMAVNMADNVARVVDDTDSEVWATD